MTQNLLKFSEKLRLEEEARARAFQARLDALKLAGLKYDSVQGVEIRKAQKVEEERTMMAVELKEKRDIERFIVYYPIFMF